MNHGERNAIARRDPRGNAATGGHAQRGVFSFGPLISFGPRLVLCLLPVLSAWSLPGTECIPLSGSRIRAGELARYDARFRMLAPETDLGFMPDLGERRRIPLPWSASDASPGGAKRPGSAGADPENPEDPFVCVERASAPLREEAIREALDLSAGDTPSVPAAVKFRVLRFSEGSFPEGVLRFSRGGISPPPPGVASVLWRGSIEYEPGRTVAIWAEVELRREGACLRSRKALRAGEALTADTWESAPCDAAAILAGAFAAEDHPGAQVAVRAILKGEWLTDEVASKPPPVVARREASLCVQSGAARLVLAVIPEQSGAEGEMVWVRVPATRERLQARVAGTDRLERVVPAREIGLAVTPPHWRAARQ